MILSQKDFTINVAVYREEVDEDGNSLIVKTFIPISSYEQNKNKLTGTYNEKLTEKENNIYNLSFNIELFNNGHRNPILEYLVNDRQIRLERGKDIMDFYITSRTPTFSNNNICYAITCQDAFSWQLSKQKINIDLSTEDELIWKETGPKTIYELSTKVLELAKITDVWKIEPLLSNDIIQFPGNLYNVDGQLKVSMELTGTTPYNAFVEIAKLFNAVIDIDYSIEPHIVNFYNREKLDYKGVKLNPNINLSAFSFSDKADNLYNVMHVTGGEDANGNYITMLPEMPSIVSEFLIMFSRDNVYTEQPIFDNYYIAPYYYVVYSDGDANPYTLYSKKSIIEEDITIANYDAMPFAGIEKPMIPNYVLFWEDIIHNSTNGRGTDLIYNNLLYFLDRQSENMGTNYSDYRNQFKTYFNQLKDIQHVSSAFYDFSYWLNSGLLSKNRYENLQKMINYDLRNINLLINSYSPTYYKLMYLLNQLIDKEEEYISLMSAEDRLIATYNESSDVENSGYLSLRGIYGSNSKIVTNDNGSSYYILIGCGKQGFNSIYYQVKSFNEKGEPDSYITHYLPDFSVLKKILQQYNNLLFTFIDDTPSNIQLLSSSPTITDDDIFDNNGELIMMNNKNLNNIPVYLKYYETSNNGNIDVTSELAGSLQSDLLKIDSIGTRKIEDYMQNISSLWNDTYVYHYHALYGSDWFNIKLSDIKTKQKAKLNEKNKIELKLKSSFGEQWRSIDTNTLSDSKFIEYSDLTKQLEDICLYVGGIGSRKKTDGSYYTYKGIYDYYIDCINAYLYNKTFSKGIKPIAEILEKLNQRKVEWETLFYKNYSDIIRETNYSDENQLTSTGLYTSAWKQFKQYSQPTKSYSASYISTSNLINLGEELKVGEVIKLQHEMLKEIVKTNWIKLTVNEVVGRPLGCVIGYIDKNEVEQTLVCKIHSFANRMFTIYDPTNVFDINTDSLSWVKINNITYTFKTGYHIECVEKVFESEEVDLRVTGVTKDLRSNVAQLTVEENTLYNTLVDRLIYLLKNN